MNVRQEEDSLVEHLLSEVKHIRQQLSERDRQVLSLTDELRQLNERASEASKRHDTIVLTLTQQLDRANLQLEDMRSRQKQSWWQRLTRI